MSTTLAIGCGGTMGGAWIIGALAAFERQTGFDPRSADIIQGTSAGAEIGMLLGAGYSVSDLVAMLRGRAPDRVLQQHFDAAPGPLPPRPSSIRPASPGLVRQRGVSAYTALAGLLPPGGEQAGWLRATARAVANDQGWVDHPGLRLVAMDYATGERVAFGAPHVRRPALWDAVSASWAVPGWVAPVIIDGRRFVDGGTASTASVDLLPESESEVVVVAPMASLGGERVPGLGGMVEAALRRPMSAALSREIAQLRARGRRVTLIDADADSLRTLGANFMARRRRAGKIEQILSDADARVTAVLNHHT